MPPCPLVLGTVQLGLPYGLANKTGQPDQKMASAIVREAWGRGIREYDTAQCYGTSEAVLGKALFELAGKSEAKVISKFDPSINHLDVEEMRKAVEASLKRIGVPCLYGMMLHREELLKLWNRGLGEILFGLKDAGLVQHLGASVYSPYMAIQAIEIEGISMLQIPSNYLDRRFEKAGVFERAEDAGICVYIRSVFLQGLLLTDFGNLPEKMDFTAPILRRLETFTQEIGLPKTDLALGYVKNAYPNARILFGVETVAQLKDTLRSWQQTLPPDVLDRVREEFLCIDERILNPSLW